MISIGYLPYIHFISLNIINVIFTWYSLDIHFMFIWHLLNIHFKTWYWFHILRIFLYGHFIFTWYSLHIHLILTCFALDIYTPLISTWIFLIFTWYTLYINLIFPSFFLDIHLIFTCYFLIARDSGGCGQPCCAVLTELRFPLDGDNLGETVTPTFLPRHQVDKSKSEWFCDI